LIGCLHRHTTEVGNEMRTVSVTGDIALRTFARVLPSKGKHITAVTAPVRAHVGERFESMWDTMVNLLLITILREKR